MSGDAGHVSTPLNMTFRVGQDLYGPDRSHLIHLSGGQAS